MKRLLTAAVGVPVVVAAIFLLPSRWFVVGLLAVFELAAVEYVRLGRHWAPRAPLASLLLLVPLSGSLLAWDVIGAGWPAGREVEVAAVGLVALGALVLWRPTPVEEAMAALGLLGFGVPYLALPIAALARIQAADPWLFLLVVAAVWLGDSAAYYVGSARGRHKLAPVVSPNKSWEGAVASTIASLAAATVWSYWRLDHVDVGLLGLAVVASVAAQLGDLVESAIKRGAGVKDSGNGLPGHGGWLDRLDAILFAAPIWWVGFQWLRLAG